MSLTAPFYSVGASVLPPPTHQQPKTKNPKVKKNYLESVGILRMGICNRNQESHLRDSGVKSGFRQTFLTLDWALKRSN